MELHCILHKFSGLATPASHTFNKFSGLATAAFGKVLADWKSVSLNKSLYRGWNRIVQNDMQGF